MNIDILARVRGSIKSEPPTKLEVGPDFILRSRPGAQATQFQYFYRQDHTNLDVFVRHVQPLIDLFFSGYNVCFMTYGETDSGKSYTLAGDSSYKSGVIPLAIGDIFKKLEAGDDILPGGIKKTGCKVLVSMIEIFDEKIRDLMVVPTSSKDFLNLGESAEKGTHVKALSYVQVAKASEATTFFREAWNRRTATMVNNKQAGDRSTIIFQITLNLTTIDSPLPNTSKFTFVDLPGAEKIVLDSTDMRLREGPIQNKAIIGFGRTVADLSTKSTANRVISYDESIVTSLLEDELGGNCKTRVLVCLKPFPDSDILSAVLRTAYQLALVRNFPIINDYFAQQLIVQFRARLIAGGRWDPGSEITPEAMSKMNREVRDELRRVQTENLELRDKNERLSYRLDSLQNRFGNVAHDRSDISTQLLSSEEEKLKVSKALMEIEIENNKLREEAETIRVELTNKILALENELLEAQMQRDRYQADALRLQDVERERKELSEEYIALKGSYHQMSKDYQTLINKNEELSMELLNLVNAKATLLRQMGTIQMLKEKRIADPDIEIERIRNMIARNRADIATAASEEKRLDRLKKGERKLKKYEMGDEVMKLRNHYDEEQRKLKLKIGELIRDLQDAKTLAKNRLQDMSQTKATIATLKNENDYLELQLNRMQHKVKGIYEEYKNRLIRYVETAAEYADAKRAPEMPQLRDYTSQMLDDIKNAHEMREAQLSSAAKNYRTKMLDVRKRYKHILIHYENLRQQVIESGDSNIVLGPDIEELLLRDPDDEATHKEITRLENELKKVKERPNPTHGNDADYLSIRKQMKDFTRNIQADLETERADLLAQNQVLQEQLKDSQDFIDKHLSRYRDEAYDRRSTP